MEVDIINHEGVVCIIIDGRIDNNTVPCLQSHILENLALAEKAVIDLSKLEYLSSEGLSLLLQVYHHVDANEGKVILAGVSKSLLETMNVAGFVEHFGFAKNIEEALQLF